MGIDSTNQKLFWLLLTVPEFRGWFRRLAGGRCFYSCL